MRGSIWRFAGFSYSAETGLTRDGARITLGPQARQLLELLLEAKGEVVTKGQIAERLWPDRPPSDDSIDRCAYLLRKPLRDAGAADLIATSYGRGLSLRAPVEVVDLAAPQGPTAGVSARILELWQAASELAGPRTRDGYQRAQAAVAAAADLDSTSPAVWALAADLAIARAIRCYLAPAEAAAAIEEATGRALALAPDFAAALAALGWSRATFAGLEAEGLALLDAAVAHDPRYGRARLYRSWALVIGDRLDNAFAEAEAGLSHSPLDQSLLALHAWLGLCAEGTTKGEALARRGLESRPDGGGLRVVLAIAASLEGRHDEAVDAAATNVEAIPGDPIMLATLSYVQARAGRLTEAEAALAASAAMSEAAGPCLFLAAASLALGRRDEALATLERGLVENCPWSRFGAHDPRLAEVRPELTKIRAETRAALGG